MITAEQYDQFLINLLAEIDCDWVIVGGSLLALLKASNRSTSDIDICTLGELTNERRLQLMKIAQASGLPIEAVNPSADFFLREIPNWKESLVLFRSGKNGNLYRPSIELYFKLKLNRCSPTDVSDCVSFLKWHNENSLSYDKNNLITILSLFTKDKTRPILQLLGCE